MKTILGFLGIVLYVGIVIGFPLFVITVAIHFAVKYW
jgi:hypothetical protein